MLELDLKKVREHEYETKEIRKVLSMHNIPVAVIVNLPRIRSDMGFTDLLLYFPYYSRVRVFEYTIDGWLHGCSIKDFGFYGDGHEFFHRTVKTYPYAVSLMPFLKFEEPECIGKFWLYCSSSGVDGVEVRVGYDDEHREKEWVELYWFSGSSYPEKFTKIGRWTPHRDSEKQLLIWKSFEGQLFKETLYSIPAYFSDEEEG